jgi:hypothetical protein
MQKIYLVLIKKGSGIYGKDEEVKKFEKESDVRALVGDIAAGSNYMDEEQELEKIYEVDLYYGRMKELEPVLENMKIKLKEVPQHVHQS